MLFFIHSKKIILYALLITLIPASINAIELNPWKWNINLKNIAVKGLVTPIYKAFKETPLKAALYTTLGVSGLVACAAILYKCCKKKPKTDDRQVQDENSEKSSRSDASKDKIALDIGTQAARTHIAHTIQPKVEILSKQLDEYNTPTYCRIKFAGFDAANQIKRLGNQIREINELIADLEIRLNPDLFQYLLKHFTSLCGQEGIYTNQVYSLVRHKKNLLEINTLISQHIKGYKALKIIFRNVISQENFDTHLLGQDAVTKIAIVEKQIGQELQALKTQVSGLEVSLKQIDSQYQEYVRELNSRNPKAKDSKPKSNDQIQSDHKRSSELPKDEDDLNQQAQYETESDNETDIELSDTEDRSQRTNQQRTSKTGTLNKMPKSRPGSRIDGLWGLLNW